MASNAAWTRGVTVMGRFTGRRSGSTTPAATRRKMYLRSIERTFRAQVIGSGPPQVAALDTQDDLERCGDRPHTHADRDRALGREVGNVEEPLRDAGKVGGEDRTDREATDRHH